MNLANKTAIITGANQGLGKAIAEAYVNAGANILICARNEEKLTQAHADLSKLAADGQKIIQTKCDVSSMAETQAMVAMAIETLGRIDILVNNAGVYGPKGAIDEIDLDEWRQAMDINLGGVVNCTAAVLPHMKANNKGKLITLSGGGATKPMPYLSAYAASKAAVVRLMETIAGEVKAHNIDCNTVAPGALNTRLLDEVIAAGPEAIGQAFYDNMLKVKAKGGTPLSVGASLAVYLGSAQSDGVTGKLISAVWDPWKEFQSHIEDLQTDIYTLRRIIPSERNMDWGDVD